MKTRQQIKSDIKSLRHHLQCLWQQAEITGDRDSVRVEEDETLREISRLAAEYRGIGGAGDLTQL